MALQFVRETPAAHAITAFDGATFRIGERSFSHPISISHLVAPARWLAAEPLDDQSLAVGCRLESDIVIIGTGDRQTFPAASALRPLVEAGIGFEVMHTRAACRTFNILLSEGRRVGALLFVSTMTAEPR